MCTKVKKGDKAKVLAVNGQVKTCRNGFKLDRLIFYRKKVARK